MSQPALSIHLLGELEVRREGRALTLPASKKTRALLAYLAAVPGDHRRTSLCEFLWEGPDDPRAALRWSLTKLRPLVNSAGAVRLAAGREHACLEPRSADIDLHVVRAALGATSAGFAGVARVASVAGVANFSGVTGVASSGSIECVPLEILRSSAARFRGEFLEGLDLPDCYRFHEWLIAEREAVRGLRLSALRALAFRLAEPAPTEALAYARAWVALDPFDEAAQAAVIRVLGRMGRIREAVAQYQSCRRLLQQELGVAPGAAIEAARRGLRAATAPLEQRPTAPVESDSVGRDPVGRDPVGRDPVGRDPVFRDPVAPRVALPHPSGAPAPTMVGRTRELRTLERLLAEATGAIDGTDATKAIGATGATGAATHPVVLLLGEPGIGKTRLLSELMSVARRAGAPVLYGRAFEAEMVRPYGAWIDALRSTDLGRIPAALRFDLAPLLPELGTGATASGDRERLFLAVATLIAGGSGDLAPALVVLDDLHWIDDASAALIHFVTRAAAGPRVPGLRHDPAAGASARSLLASSATPRPLICCAARPGELADNPSALRLLRALGRERRLRRLELQPLDRETTAELVRSIDPDVDGSRVFAGSEGNPLFAIELARAHAHGRGAEGAVPDTLSELIADRLARLEPTARDLVPWAAALGRSFEPDILGSAASLSPSELLTAVTELERHAILRPAATGAIYDFSHDLVRQAAYRQISAPRRGLMHRQIARVLATRADQEAALAGEIAQHASLAGEHELAALSCARAGERSLRLFANAEAGELAQRGLRHARALAPAARLPVQMRLYRIHVHSRLGRDRSAQVEQEIQRLTLEAREAGLHAEVHTGLYLLAVLHDEGGNPLAAQELSLSHAEAARIADPRTAARALANTGRCLAQIERDLPRAESLLEEAQELAERVGVDIIDLPWGAGLVRHFRGDDAGAYAALAQALAIARREFDHWAEYQCLERLTMIDLESGHTDAALGRQAELHAVAARLSEGSEAPMATMLEALARRAQAPAGEPLTAGAVERALDALRAIDTKGLLSYALNFAANQDLAAGDCDHARQHAEEALAAATAVGRRTEVVVALALLARLAARDGDGAATADHLAAAGAAAGGDSDPVHRRAHGALELAGRELSSAATTTSKQRT